MSIVEYLRKRGVEFETLLHQPASTSARRAGCMHVPGRSVAKAVLVQARDQRLVAVLPATCAIDLERLSAILRVQPTDVRIASEAEARAVFKDCEAGVVPPFGRLYDLPTVVDSELAGSPTIAFGGNMRHEDVRMQFRDFVTLEAPLSASFSRPAHAV